MQAFFQRLEKAMVDADLCLSYGQKSPQSWGPKIFTYTVMQEAGTLLERALAAASDATCRRRVEFFQKGFEEARHSLAKMKKAARK
jgi:hypothetical protein